MKNTAPTRKIIAALLALAAGVFAPAQAASPEDSPAAAQKAWASRADALIVKFRVPAAKAGGPARARVLSDALGVELLHARELATGATLLALPAALPLPEVEALAARIAQDPAVAYAEPDRRMLPLATPNDPDFGRQWHLTDYLGGINAPAAWDITTGAAGTVVAVLDTGSTTHPDIVSRLLPGYDFISNITTANDGDGRDANPADPGNWLTQAEKAAESQFADCTVRNSNWHGTLVGGVIGAATQNGRDLAGIDWSARILPVRVLGKCGGATSDIAEAMMWAAGIAVPGVPDNPTPAKVLNLSLGAVGSCGNTYQNAINQVIAAGKIVVVAAGNENTSQDNSPSACQGVINVAATGRNGSKASYSSFGPRVTLAAPGGDGSDLVTLSNTGTTVPAAPTTLGTQGTSFAAPVASGVLALMLALRPDLDATTARQILVASVRPFPDATCTLATCGAGILDAAAALRATRDQSLGIATFVGFQDADVGRPNADLVLKVTNLSAQVQGAATTVVSGTDFTVTGNTCASFAPGATCDITLRFNPAARDLRQGELTIAATDGRLYRVALAGFAYAAATITQQSAGTSGGPLYFARAVDGSYWYTQSGVNRVARTTPQGVVTEFPVPTANSNPFDIVAGADGNMWFTQLDAGKIGRITPAGVVTEFALPNAGSQPRGIALGSDGNVWFTEILGQKIGRITPTGVITEFDIPWANSAPRGIARGPDGNLWFTDSGGLSIGRLTPTGTFTRFSLPWTSDNLRGIVAGPDGNLWFTELTGNRIGRITTSGVMTEFPLPRAGAGPLAIAVGPDNKLWYTASSANRVGSIDPANGTITEYRLPSAGSSPIGVIAGPGNQVWFAASGTSVNRIVKLAVPGLAAANDYTDLWWAGQAQNGWGMSIQQHGNALFAALYVYDSAGRPTWYVLPTCTWSADFTNCTGQVYQPTSAALNNYNPAQFAAGAPRGTLSLTFTTNATAILDFTIDGVSGQKFIERQPFGGSTAPLTVGDLWWGGRQQDGWGVTLTQHDGVVFGVWYTYGSDGRPTWFVLPTGTWTGNTYAGTLYSTAGSAWLGATYNPAALVVTPVGNLSLAFSSAAAAGMTYSFNAGPFAGVTQTKPIERQPF